MSILTDKAQSGVDTGGAPSARLYRIARLEQPAHHLTLARLEPADEAPLAFLAGQFVRVGFDGFKAKDLSIANCPGESWLEFHIRDLPHRDGRLFERLAAGMSARVEGPFGKGFWREDFSGPTMLIAGGSGIAPIKSIVETALRKGVHQPIHLYFGVRGEADLYLESHFETLARKHTNLRFVPVLSEGAASERRQGMVGEALSADFAALAGWKAYVFGPPVMVEATTRVLCERGLASADIHTDDPAEFHP